MNIPDQLRRELIDYLWKEADDLGWSALSPTEKAKWYGIWTESDQVGRRLSPYMDPRRVRVYIKDTLLKAYTRERMANVDDILCLLGMDANTPVVAEFIKPHGRLLKDRRLIAWSNATDWKLTLMALHERSYRSPRSKPFAAVLLNSSERFSDPNSRVVVDDAARMLGIELVIWAG